MDVLKGSGWGKLHNEGSRVEGLRLGVTVDYSFVTKLIAKLLVFRLEVPGGFEPPNNGFADRPLRPLGHGTPQRKLYYVTIWLAEFGMRACQTTSSDILRQSHSCS